MASMEGCCRTYSMALLPVYAQEGRMEPALAALKPTLLKVGTSSPQIDVPLVYRVHTETGEMIPPVLRACIADYRTRTEDIVAFVNALNRALEKIYKRP